MRLQANSPTWWPDAIKQFLERDQVLKQLIQKFPNSCLIKHSSPFEVLINAVVGQQISVKAADRVRKNLIKLVSLTPKNILKAGTERLLSAGLSKQKVQYMVNIANWFTVNNINSAWFENTNSEIISQNLLDIKGIGRWTLQMFQIFYLQESDILPISDIGLIKAVEKAYELSRDEAISQIQDIACAKWKPYSTAAVWFLWRNLDPQEVSY